MLRQRLVRPCEHVEHVPNFKLMAAAEGPVAEFSSFANLEEKKRKSNLLMSFPKTGNQMGSFGQIRKNSFFRFCRPTLDIFGFTLLSLILKFSTAIKLYFIVNH